MDCSSTTLNPSSNISKFPKASKLRSIGVFLSDTPDPNHHVHVHVHDLNINNASFLDNNTKGAELDLKKAPCSKLSISKLFDIVSKLKLAYVQLQQAHIPYDRDKIVAADHIFVVQLGSLCAIMRSYKEEVMKAKLEYSRLDCLKKEVKVNAILLKKLKSLLKTKDDEIVCLKQEFDGLDSTNRNLVERIKTCCFKRMNSTNKVSSVSVFEDAYKAAYESIHDFAKPLITLLKASGWDIDLVVNSIQEEVVYSRKSSKKYAFEAYISRRMFHGMSLESYTVDDDIMAYDDPIDALVQNPNSRFAEFCRDKYLLVVHPSMEASFYGNLDQRTFVLSNKHPRTLFYHTFVKMAKWVWILMGIASSIDPQVKIFSVKRGSEYSDIYMEFVELGGVVIVGEGQTTPKVEFMVMPGFKIGERLVRSKVYLSTKT